MRCPRREEAGFSGRAISGNHGAGEGGERRPAGSEPCRAGPERPLAARPGAPAGLRFPGAPQAPDPRWAAGGSGARVAPGPHVGSRFPRRGPAGRTARSPQPLLPGAPPRGARPPPTAGCRRGASRARGSCRTNRGRPAGLGTCPADPRRGGSGNRRARNRPARGGCAPARGSGRAARNYRKAPSRAPPARPRLRCVARFPPHPDGLAPRAGGTLARRPGQLPSGMPAPSPPCEAGRGVWVLAARGEKMCRVSASGRWCPFNTNGIPSLGLGEEGFVT